MVKTVVVATIVAVIALTVFRKIYKDYKKNKNFCGTDCCSCSGASSCNSHRETEDYNK